VFYESYFSEYILYVGDFGRVGCIYSVFPQSIEYSYVNGSHVFLRFFFFLSIDMNCILFV